MKYMRTHFTSAPNFNRCRKVFLRSMLCSIFQIFQRLFDMFDEIDHQEINHKIEFFEPDVNEKSITKIM